MVAKGVTF